jgi:hypothetical protein
MTQGYATNGTDNAHDHDGGDGAQVNHTKLSNIGTNTHAQVDTHLGASAAVHGLPANVNVLGNRTGAGEFIQRGTADPAVCSNATTVYRNTATGISFAVAFTACYGVFVSTTSGADNGWFGVIQTSTTSFYVTSFATGNTTDYAEISFIAFGK